MSLRLTQRQHKLRARSRQFAGDVLAGVGKATAHLPTTEERFLATRPAYEQLVAAGFLRGCIPASCGGDSQSLIDTAILTEELFCGDTSVALTLVGTVLGVQPVVSGGTESQRERLLAPFLRTSGAPLAGFCSSEPGGSANAAAPAPAEGLRSTAVRKGGHWYINGTKKWVSSATGWDRGGAEVLCVLCRTDPDAPPMQGVSIIAVERSTAAAVDGLTLDRVIESPGYKAHLLPEFSFHDVTADADDVIGPEGGGLALGSAAFASAAALIGIIGVALMRSAFAHTLRFARTEYRGGPVPIIDHQAVGYALADAKTTIEAARSLAWRACLAVDTGHPATAELANQAKIFGSEAAVQVVTDLMRVVGVDSYDLQDPLNGLLQDALALPVFASGNLGMRRRTLHTLLRDPGYDPLTAYDAG
ncbi:acyl-CoA dehydrogenase family protein [Pseudonocardia alni]|uniref:acyl-CoA dehydrogenase family protein n=1 Tax=Pseudonocardia alni TaxID=33907 RepID=UPI003332AEFA